MIRERHGVIKGVAYPLTYNWRFLWNNHHTLVTLTELGQSLVDVPFSFMP